MKIRKYLELSRSGTYWGITILSHLIGSNTNYSLVDCCLNAVVHFNVQFRKGVIIKSRRLLDISESGCIYNISNGREEKKHR